MNQIYRIKQHLSSAIATTLLLAVFMMPQTTFADNLKCTVLDICYCVTPKFEKEITANVKKVREQLKKHREKGEFVAYISIPLTSQGGGDNTLDQEVSESIYNELMKKYGKGFWALAPGVKGGPRLPDAATDGDWMYMWTQILAGENGLGEDFDAVFFTGPESFLSHMGASGNNVIEQLRKFAKNRATQLTTTHELMFPKFNKKISQQGAMREFIDNYAFRSSVAFSEGCHDEWNIFHAINRNRLANKKYGIIKQLPVFFDGKAVAPSAYATPISAGAQNVCSPL